MRVVDLKVVWMEEVACFFRDVIMSRFNGLLGVIRRGIYCLIVYFSFFLELVLVGMERR